MVHRPGTGALAVGITGSMLMAYNVPVIKAEEPKPIYDDVTKPIDSHQQPQVVIKEPPKVLEQYVRETREYVSKVARFVSVHLDIAGQQYFKAEAKVTSTVSGLKSDKEPILPGVVYISIAILSGSILARKRNRLLRSFIVPGAFGFGTFALVLPNTYRNTTDLIWQFEKKVPALANAHLATKQIFTDSIRATKKLSRESRKIVDKTVSSTRRAFQDSTGLKIEEESKK
ncbi:apolipo protein O-domain-containing protein [Lipomyces japonicus]|uniref:apolipo protein O-domain-containing protein n=1 Tax=Lipomyces japonicus TaxID=56871 RepID=UPI0034CD7A4A